MGDTVRRLPPLRSRTAYDSGKDGGSRELPPTPEATQGTPKVEPLTRRQKKNLRASRRRSLRRAKAQALGSTTLKGVSRKKRRLGSIRHALKLPFDVASCGAATGPGWVGRRLQDLPVRAFTLEDLKREFGVRCFEWDGRYVTTFLTPTFAHGVFRTPHLLLDRENRVIGALAGRPHGATDWGAVHDSALASLESVSKKLNFSQKDKAHRRGSYISISHGLSFGGGQQVRAHPRL